MSQVKKDLPVIICKDCGARYKNQANFDQHLKTKAHRVKVKDPSASSASSSVEEPERETRLTKSERSEMKRVAHRATGHTGQTGQTGQPRRERSPVASTIVDANPFGVLADLDDE